MIDPFSAFRALALGKKGVTDLVGDRVYVGALPQGFSKTEIAPKAVLIQGPDGSEREPRRAAPLLDFECSALCFGETAAEAGKVFGALYDALHCQGRQTATYGIGMGAKTARWVGTFARGLPKPMQDPDTGWMYSRGAFGGILHAD